MTGLITAISIHSFPVVIGGCLVGMFIGPLSGLGPTLIIVNIIPVAVTIGDPSATPILLAGVYFRVVIGESTSSILINASSVTSMVAISIAGYPTSRRAMQAGR